MKAAIALDDWKLPVFRKRLTEAGFKYEDAGEATPGTTFLTVHYDAADFLKLAQVVRVSADQCARKGKP